MWIMTAKGTLINLDAVAAISVRHPTGPTGAIDKGRCLVRVVGLDGKSGADITPGMSPEAARRVVAAIGAMLGAAPLGDQPTEAETTAVRASLERAEAAKAARDATMLATAERREARRLAAAAGE